VVIDDVEHLEGRAAGDADVGDVALPAFVGELGGKADPGALGPLVRLRGDQPAGLEHPPDRGHRRHLLMPLGQVVVNGRRPGVEPGAGQVLAQRGDLLLPAAGDPGRRAVRAPGAGLQPGRAPRL